MYFFVTGEAFVIFKTREAAEKALKKLDEGCLMLPNGRYNSWHLIYSGYLSP